MSDGPVQHTVCALCALKARLKGEPAVSFQEGPEEHLNRVHPDPKAMHDESVELRRQFQERLDQAQAARFN